jgi:hypothetical protein
MKRLAFLSLLISTLIAPIQVQAQQYDPARNCVRFPQQPNPEAEARGLGRPIIDDEFLMSNGMLEPIPSFDKSGLGFQYAQIAKLTGFPWKPRKKLECETLNFANISSSRLVIMLPLKLTLFRTFVE